MFMTESSLVSSLHDTMATGEQQNGGRRCGGTGGEEQSENRVRRGRGRGESVRRELDRSSFYPHSGAGAAVTPLDGVSLRP